jgi:cell division protein FtsL
MKQEEENITPDPRQVLTDIAEREAKAAANDTKADKAADSAEGTTDKTVEDGSAESFLSVIKGHAEEGEKANVADLNLAKILGGDILNTTFIRRQIGVILIIFVFILIYISNRYSCQQNLIKIDQLTKDLQDAKYRALSSNSELTEQSRESKVLEKLKSNKDSVLHIPTQPPYIINVPTNN